jgi:spore coat polysaccharide biosynthesis protein SpsF
MVTSSFSTPRHRVLAVLQARTSSTRFPGKILAEIDGIPMIQHQISRIKRATRIDELVVATSTDPSDDALVALCSDLGVAVVRGSLSDVLGRFMLAASEFPSEYVVRLTADCPLTSPKVLDSVIEMHIEYQSDYTSNCHPPTFPDGLDVEVMTYEALSWAQQNATTSPEREHVTLAIASRPERFTLANLTMQPDCSSFRWTVDLPEDLDFVRSVYAHLYPNKPDFDFQDVFELIETMQVSSHTDKVMLRNESLTRQLSEDA